MFWFQNSGFECLSYPSPLHRLYTLYLFPLFLLQYDISEAELESRTLWVSVWDWDRFGRNQFLGEVRLPLSSLDLSDTNDHWHALQDKVCTRSSTTVQTVCVSNTRLAS